MESDQQLQPSALLTHFLLDLSEEADLGGSGLATTNNRIKSEVLSPN
jgi:hypothetical protein